MAAYNRLTAYLLTPDVQAEIMRTTWHRPAVPGVALSSAFGHQHTFALPFPTSVEVIDDLASAYAGTQHCPACTIYVLDTSGSMAGAHLSEVKTAIDQLTQSDSTFSAPGTTLQTLDEVTFLPVNTVPAAARTFQLQPDNTTPTLQAIRTYVAGLSAGGWTALYDVLVDAYRLVQQQTAADSYHITSIVLLTDGGGNTGRDLAQFTAFYRI